MTSPSSDRTGPTRPLVCPGCATTYPLDERFCARCGMPLTYSGTAVSGDDPITDTHERARKIKPQLAEGELVKVAGASNQTEAEFLQGMLLEEGVPSTLRRARGFDVPDFLAAGPRDVMVPASGVDVARDVLLEAELGSIVPGSDGSRATGVDSPARILGYLVAAIVLVGVIALVGTELFGPA